MDPKPDVVLVGGGLIGCALAYQLAKAGAQVTLVERQALGQEASWASGGLISPPKPSPLGAAHAELEARSLRLYPALVAELAGTSKLDLRYVNCGRLSVAFTDEEAADLQAMRHWQQQFGFTHESLTGDEARQRVPLLSPTVRAALWCPEASCVRSGLLTLALAEAAGHLGMTLRTNCPVTGLLTTGNRVTGVQTADGPLTAGTTVLTTGAWTGELGQLLQLSLPVRPVRGQMLAMVQGKPALEAAIAGAGGFLIPRTNGTVVAAATVEEAGFRNEVTPGGLAWLGHLVAQLAPAYSDAQITASWSGLRPAPADGAPLLGKAPHYRGLWIAAGHMRDGILWAPITAELLASSIRADTIDPLLAAYDPGRFSQQA